MKIAPKQPEIVTPLTLPLDTLESIPRPTSGAAARAREDVDNTHTSLHAEYKRALKAGDVDGCRVLLQELALVRKAADALVPDANGRVAPAQVKLARGILDAVATSEQVHDGIDKPVPPPPKSLMKMLPGLKPENADVSRQMLLVRLGYDVGDRDDGRLGVDGVIGPKTTEALKAFQRDNGLAQTGRFDAGTLNAMRERWHALVTPSNVEK